MKTVLLNLTPFLLVIILAFTPIAELPNNWHKAGSHPDSYEMGMDNQVFNSGAQSAYIQSKKEKIKGFGTLMQSSKVGKYRGKKVKMTGFIKTESVKGWSGMWLRIDPANGGKSLSFDNMYNRKLTGTKDWSKYEIVLDVPAGSYSMSYGVLLNGTGKVWFDDISFEITEGLPTNLNEQPTNVDFEE